MMQNERLPEVQLYSIGPAEAEHAAPLLTAEALSLLRAGEAAGMALAEEGEVRAAACARLSPENEEVLELLSLYVSPAYRRRGLGGTLLMELVERSMDATDSGLRWVTAAFLAETEGMEALLTEAGFRTERDGQTACSSISAGELADSALLTRRVSLPEGCALCALGALSDIALRELEQTLAKNGIDDMSAAEMRRAMQESSFVLLDCEEHPKACAIVTAQDGGAYLSQFFAASGSADYAMPVLQAAAKSLWERLPADAVLEIPVLTESSGRLVRRLLPQSRVTPLVRATLTLN